MCRPLNAQPCTLAGQLSLFPTWTRPPSLANKFQLVMTICLAFTATSDLGLVMFSSGKFQKLRRDILLPFSDLNCDDEERTFLQNSGTNTPGGHNPEDGDKWHVLSTRTSRREDLSNSTFWSALPNRRDERGTIKRRQTARNSIFVSSELLTLWRIKRDSN